MEGSKYTYTALFELDYETGGYVISFPDIPGANTEAETVADGLFRAREVLEIFVSMYEDDKKDMPTSTSFRELASRLQNEDDFLQLVTVDSEKVRRKEQMKAVTKSVTLPKWLLEAGKLKKINFSQLLQRALHEELKDESYI